MTTTTSCADATPVTHEQGPWHYAPPQPGTIFGAEVRGPSGDLICRLSRHPRKGAEADANGRRIVACVNACEGIATDQLAGLLNATQQDRRQRDALLAVLESAVAHFDEWAAGYGEDDTDESNLPWLAEARAAIANIKGANA